MGQVTNIAWTNHTFNPWRGCTKISDGCTFCYAEAQSRRNQKVLGVWGPKGTREIAADAYWKQALKWDMLAREAGESRTVFCASLADIFEGYDTMPAAARVAVSEARTRLFRLIVSTPNLEWLLLTKRPANVQAVISEAMCDFDNEEAMKFSQAWQSRVWLGASVEDQPNAEVRVPQLVSSQPGRDASVRFLSVEPMLGSVTLRHLPKVDWVICGGESGASARPFDMRWARVLLKECEQAGVPFFMKQCGAHTLCCLEEKWPIKTPLIPAGGGRFRKHLIDKKGADPSEWPEEFARREWPAVKVSTRVEQR